MKKKFGELLIERHLITAEQLADALALQRRRGMRLGAALVALGHLSEHALVDALGSVLHFPVVDLEKMPHDSAALGLVSGRFAQDHQLFPYALRKDRGRRILSIAMSDPLNYRVIDELSFITEAQVEPALARASAIDAAITQHYGRDYSDGRAWDAPAYDKRVVEEQIITIVRPGGVEEEVDVTTGRVVSPFHKEPPPRVQSNAVLLTEEVDASTPVDAATLPPGANIAGPGAAPSMGAANAMAAAGGHVPRFDEALGALIDAAGAAVQAESFERLEKRFWALMRILARKGVLTKEEFIAEVGRE